MKAKKILGIYLKDLELQRFSSRTIRNYRTVLNAFISHLESEGIEEIENITSAHIKAYIGSKGQNKATYINGIIKRIKVFFKWCLEEEYIDRDISKKIKSLKEEKTVITIFNDKEMKELLEYYSKDDYISVRNRSIMYLLCETGVRALEVCKLKLESIKGDYLLIDGKGNKQRVVPITNILRKQLNRYSKARSKFAKEEDWLFLSRRHKQLTTQTIEVIVKEASENCNIRSEVRCSPHTLRHFMAVSNLKNGMDLFTLSKLLGHEDIKVTEKYLQSMTNEEILELSKNSSNLEKLNMKIMVKK